MALYLDSAILSEALLASEWGWVCGVTTNPTLLAKSDLAPEETLQKLAATQPGEVFYQLTAPDLGGMLREARTVHGLLRSQTVLKIPATPTGFQATARLSPEITCAVTAIFSPAQAVVAAEAGAKYTICYVNRATRLLGDGLALVSEMAGVLRGSQTEILAASLKSPQEAIATLQAGARHLTLPFATLQALSEHELSAQAVAEFARSGRGVRY